MATITTTIKEPKTFQQIQEQQNELGKQSTLESLNNNIAKLIKTINIRDEKKETEQDRQLKMNQLELSKLQLRRAQLGLAKDQKYYQDYSRKWDEKNGIGASVGIDKNTSQNAGAIALSAATLGMINPVVIKQILFPILSPTLKILAKTTGALASFPGILPMLSHKISGKTSSAIEGNSNRKLHGKLDQILGAIKNKTKGELKQKEEKDSLLSKLLKMLVLGAAGLSLVSAALGGEEGIIKNTLLEHGKAMLAGFALGGWKGALIGLALDVFAKTAGIIPKKTDGPTIINVAADNAVSKLAEWSGIQIEKKQFELAVAGLMAAGPKGMLVGYLLGNSIVRDAIKALQTDGLTGLKTLADREILQKIEGTAFEGIPPDAIEGGIIGGALGSKAGIKGFVAGALLGVAGGFVWDRYKNLTVMKDAGINTQFDWNKFDYVISGSNGKTYSDYYEYFLKQKDKNGNYIYDRETAQLEAIATIKSEINEGYIDNSKKEQLGLFDQAIGFVKDHPLEIAGLAGLTLGIETLSGLIDGTKLSGKLEMGLIAAIITATLALKIKKNQDEINEEIDERQQKNPNEKISDSSWISGGKHIENGEYGKATQAILTAYGAETAELENRFEDSFERGKLRSQVISAIRSVGERTSGSIAAIEEHKAFDGINVKRMKALFPNFTEDQLKRFNELVSLKNKDWSNISAKDAALAFLISHNLDRIQTTDEKQREYGFLRKQFGIKIFDKKYNPTTLVVKDIPKITNSENDQKIQKEEQKQKDAENQCLIANTKATIDNTDMYKKFIERDYVLPNQTPIQYPAFGQTTIDQNGPSQGTTSFSTIG